MFKTKNSILLLLIMLLLVTAAWFLVKNEKARVIPAVQTHKDIYYCPMHTFYTSDKPGHCPICGMELVKKKTDAAAASGHVDHATVDITDEQKQLMGVKTTVVHQETLNRTVRTYGYTSTNDELYTLQDEYISTYLKFLFTYRNYRRFEYTRRNWESHRQLEVKLHQVEDKLLRLGFGAAQIKLLQRIDWKSAWDQSPLLFFKEKDMTRYWVVAKIFEQDLMYIKAGQKVEVEVPAYGKKFSGTIRSVGGILDEQTRTADTLIELDGEHHGLEGNMLVNVDIPVHLDSGLVVPQGAVMDTGLKKIVYVEAKPGVFEPRDVSLGAMGDNGWIVMSGLRAGERVAVEGNFLLDSESQLQASLQGGQP